MELWCLSGRLSTMACLLATFLLNARFLLLRQSAYTAVFNVSYLSFSRMIRMHDIW